MPKLGNGGFGDKFGFQIDKTDGNVGFEDSSHTYFSLEDGSRYISVTQLVGRYCQPFDDEFWSAYKALEAILDVDTWSIVKKGLLAHKKFDEKLLDRLNIDKKVFYTKQQEIKDGYAAKREEACEHGSNEHLKKELAAYKEGGKFLNKMGIAGSFKCVEGDYNIDTNHGMYPEILISHKFDNGVKISGQVDLLVCDNDEITIIDFKTNAEIKKKSYFNNQTKKSVMMKYPMNKYMDTNFFHYQAQLSLYMYLLEQRYPNIKCKKLALLHIDREGNETEYPVEYIKSDIIRMINHYSKESKIQDALSKDKPITY